ncbi:MAG: hypothetical protein AABZ11_05550 [Nitrospinota bacterium]
MEINNLQINGKIIEGRNVESANIAENYTKFASNSLDDIVEISQEAKDLANKRAADKKLLYGRSFNGKDEKDEKNPQPAGNLLIMANKYLDYYLNTYRDLAIKVRDKETRKIIKEIPLKEEQKLKAAIEKLLSDMNDDNIETWV